MSLGARGRALVEILRRRTDHFEASFRRHEMSQAEAFTVLDEAVLEVQLRCTRIEEMEPRLLRAVERGCQAAVQRRCRADDREAWAEPVEADAGRG